MLKKLEYKKSRYGFVALLATLTVFVWLVVRLSAPHPAVA